MGNYSRLMVIDGPKPIMQMSDTCTIVRYAKNIIPLLWWVPFSLSNVTLHRVENQDYETHVLFCDKQNALNSYGALAAGLPHISGFPPESRGYVSQLCTDLTAATGGGLQLELSEIECLFEFEEFRQWVEEGITFAEKLRGGSILDIRTGWDGLLDGSAIGMERPAVAGAVNQFFSIAEMQKGLEEFNRTGAPVQQAAPPAVLSCTNWEHSLIGVPWS